MIVDVGDDEQLQYLAQVEALQQDKIDHLIDFLVVAARLVLIKSMALLPRPPALGEEAELRGFLGENLLHMPKSYR